MRTIRFILAFGELVLSPAMLLLYARPTPIATIDVHPHQLLDFSPQLG